MDIHTGRSRKCIKDFSSWIFDITKTRLSFEELRAQHPRIEEDVNEWGEQRMKTIETIRNLQIKIDNVCVGCNVAQGVGSAAEIVGGIAGIVGAVLALTGHKSASQVIKGSKVCNVIGGVTSTSATLLELGLSKKIMDDAKTAVLKDEELTKPLMNWLQHSRNVNSLLERFFGCDILTDTVAVVIQVCLECIKLIETGQKEFSDLIEELTSGKTQCSNFTDLTEEVVQKILKTLKRIQQHPRLHEPLKNICNLFQKSPKIFEFAKLGMTVFFQVNCTLSDISVMSSIWQLSSIDFLKSCGGSSGVRCVFDAVQIAGNVVSIISVTKNIKEGKSKYSETLNEIRMALILELRSICRTHPSFHLDDKIY